MQGRLYNGNSSASRPVEVTVRPDGGLQLRAGRDVRHWVYEKLVIADQLAGVAAVVELPDGARLEIDDADAFYRALAPVRHRGAGLVHALERRWSLVAVSLSLTLVLFYWFMTDGIPLAARVAANAMPPLVNDFIGQEGLRVMDRFLFSETELDPERQQELQAIFADVVSVVGEDGRYELKFRGGEAIGPNAFALPAGTVVMTDEIVALADEDDELAAVLAHEVGHVVHRHAIRQLLQNSVAAGLIVIVTGDLGSAANLAAGVPAVLLNAAYTREFEREADEVAFTYLEARGINPKALGELLIRIDEQAGRHPGQTTLLDSHPSSRERLEAARGR